MKKLFLVILLATTIAQAETYTWTDTEGTVHFSDSPGDVPASVRKSAKPQGMDSNAATSQNKAAYSTAPRPSTDTTGSVAPDMEELKERMMKDEGIMALIRALQSDPQMLALLNDPAVQRALQSGDVTSLANNPAFLKLLDNPRIREIENKVQQNGTK